MNFSHLQAIGLIEEHPRDVHALGSSPHCTEDPYESSAESDSGLTHEATDGAESDETDPDVLLVATLEDGQSCALKASAGCCFYTMTLEVASLDPTVNVELVLLQFDGTELNLPCIIKGLRPAIAYRLVQIVEELSLLQWSNIVSSQCSSVRPSLQLLPPVSGLREILRLGESHADVRLPEGFADKNELACWYYDMLCSSGVTSPADFMECISITEVLPSIYCVNSTSDMILSSIFLRFQEYYECPANHIRRKCFSLDDYKSWCRGSCKLQTGFTYYTQWSGFNIPSWVLDNVEDGALGELHAREKALLESIPRVRPCYVIGALNNDVDTLHHELAHGLFGTRPDYKQETLRILEQLTPEEHGIARAQLLENGYPEDEDILLDEMQAYIVGGHRFPFGEAVPAQILATFRSTAPSLFQDD